MQIKSDGEDSDEADYKGELGEGKSEMTQVPKEEFGHHGKNHTDY